LQGDFVTLYPCFVPVTNAHTQAHIVKYTTNTQYSRYLLEIK